uniref:V-type proton ATPase subunit a n=1 Tax=Globodera pallida TaxID=36090 RepID=A0A183BQT3_GLOPA
MERKLRFLEAQIRKENHVIVDNTWHEEVDVMSHGEINEVEQKLIDKERDIISMNDSDQQLKKNFLELNEWEHVLGKTDEFFEGGISDAAVQEIEGQTVGETDAGIPLRTEKEPMGHVVGVINTEKVNAFERIIWRVCRRTAFVRHSEIAELLEHPETGEPLKESVFIVFYNGERLRNIIDKVCEGFKAKQYNQCPKTSTERNTALQQVHTNIHDMRMVMAQTREHRMKVLNDVAANHRRWLKQVRIHKSIYHTLNTFTFDGIGKFFVAECWVPLNDVNDVRTALETGVSKFGGSVKPVLNVVHTADTPPTYNRTNKFTSVFQGIVDSYGVASYLELNPAPYTIITFPFLFSIMFGDLGHGILMFLCGLYLVLREKNLEARQIRDEIFGMFFGGRYIIMLMGLFSIHAGLLYNDAFAKSFRIFGSSWAHLPYNGSEILSWQNETKEGGKEMEIHLNPLTAYDRTGGPYPFGMDPIWNLAEGNKLNFLNSMKMKLSVLTGIAQMGFGVALSYRNYKFFESPIEVYTVFIPQMVFLAAIFVYLCLQVIMKWLFFWVEPTQIFGQLYPGSHCAPSLLVGKLKCPDGMKQAKRFLEAQIRKENQVIVDNTWHEEVDVMSHGEINEVEQKLIDKERDIISMNDSDQQLKKNFLELNEWEHVLGKTDEFFEGGISDAAVQEIEGQTVGETDAGIPLRTEKEPMGHVVGVINTEKVNAFERIIWRVCRRTAFVRHSEIAELLEHPETGEPLKESVFIVFYNGERLRNIIDKVCEGFKAKQYNQCPKTSTERNTALQQVHTNIHDMRMVMAQTREHRMKVLNDVRIHKSIYHTLNTFTFDGIGKFFVAECWVPLNDVNDVRTALETGVSKFGGSVKPVLNVVHTADTPPTYNRTNKFTSVFQGIVDSYGVASYLELNPGN